MLNPTSQRMRSHLQDLIVLNPAWNVISEDDLKITEDAVWRFAPDRGIVVYDNDEDDADAHLEHYAMPPLSDADCDALFADLPMGS